ALGMQNQTPKSLFQITNLCAGFLGIQIGFALQAGNVTRILQNYGADLTEVSLFWLIAPLSGAVVQPLIGYWSDRRMNNGTSRVPFLLIGGILSVLALLALPNANVLLNVWSPLLIGAILLVLIYISFNASMHPLRPAISAYLPPYQPPRGFAIQTFLISIGAILGSTLPYILHRFFSVETISSAEGIPPNVKWSFYIGASILLITILITSRTILTQKTEVKAIASSQKTFYLPSIPINMWKLGVIQFFSWAGFFLIWIFMTPAVAQHIFSEYNYDPKSYSYSESANITGVSFGCYHLSASIFSLVLPVLYRRYYIISTHLIALLIGGFVLILVFLCTEIHQLYLPMLLLGIAWASILASPFALLSRLIPLSKVGLYFGVFNLFITLPQIAIGLFSGVIIEKLFGGEAIYAIMIAAICLIIAAMSSLIYRKSLSL